MIFIRLLCIQPFLLLIFGSDRNLTSSRASKAFPSARRSNDFKENVGSIDQAQPTEQPQLWLPVGTLSTRGIPSSLILSGRRRKCLVTSR